MQLLLDTHAFIWFAEGNTSLSAKARYLIEDPQNKKYISMVSFYEMAIKLKIGKLALGGTLKSYYENAFTYEIFVLPLSEKHLFEYDTVPLLAEHKDPFDRLIIASAIYQKLDIITMDAQFSKYSGLVNIIW